MTIFDIYFIWSKLAYEYFFNGMIYILEKWSFFIFETITAIASHEIVFFTRLRQLVFSLKFGLSMLLISLKFG